MRRSLQDIKGTEVVWYTIRHRHTQITFMNITFSLTCLNIERL